MRVVTVEMDGLVRVFGDDNINLGDGVWPVFDGERLVKHDKGKMKADGP
jgi:hypothetical protein